MNIKYECSARIERLQNCLNENQLDGALYLYPIDVFYFTATRQNATLWVPRQGSPILFVRKSYNRACQEAGIDDIRPFPRSAEFSSLFTGPMRIGMTFDVIPVQQYQYYQKLLPETDFIDISLLTREIRSLKSPWEIERMRYSGVQLSRVFASLVDFLSPGMREIDVAAEFESRLRRAGGEGLVRMRAFNQELFMGLTVAGPSASASGFFDGAVTGLGLSNAAAHGASASVIQSGQPILLDYTGIFDGYIVDMTRMAVCGRLDLKLERALDVAKSIQDWIATQLKPGTICSELFSEAVDLADKAGLAEHFMGPADELAKFVGHGVGLELDEYPVLAQGFDVPLQAGQTIAVEPKFIFTGLGAVGIENTYLVSESGGEKISVLADDLIVV